MSDEKMDVRVLLIRLHRLAEKNSRDVFHLRKLLFEAKRKK